MESSTVRIALAADACRVDLVVPARRPLGEYLAQLVSLAAPTSCASTGWHLVRVGGELLDPDRTLADAGVVDGELLMLAPGLSAPDAGAERVDDLRGAIAERLAPPRHARSAIPVTAHAIAAAATVPVTIELALADAAGAFLATTMAVVMLVGAAAWARTRSGSTVASIWGFAALAPAAVAGADVGLATAGGVSAAGAVAVAAAVGAVVVPGRAGVFGPLAGGAVTVAASIAALEGVDAAAGVAAALVVAGLAMIEAAPRVGFILVRTSGSAGLDHRLRRSRRAIVAGHVIGTTAIVVAAAALAVGDDAWGWWLVGTSAAVLALHTRRYDRAPEVVPLAVGALGAASALGLGVVGPEHGPLWAAGAVGAVGVLLAAVLGTASTMRPLTRRRLTRLELLLTIPTIALAIVASGAFDALVVAGRHLG